jgi:hypothetical protein
VSLYFTIFGELIRFYFMSSAFFPLYPCGKCTNRVDVSRHMRRHPANQPASQLVSHAVIQPVSSQSFSQSGSQPLSQSINQLISHSSQSPSGRFTRQTCRHAEMQNCRHADMQICRPKVKSVILVPGRPPNLVSLL